MKWCTKFPKPNLTCFHTTSVCWTISLFDVLKVKKVRNWIKCKIFWQTHLGDLEDDGLGALAGGGDVDVHVAVNVEVGGDHPLHLLLRLYSWPVALKIKLAWVVISGTQMSLQGWKATNCVYTLEVKAGCTFVSDKCELHWSKVNHRCSI